MRTLSPPPTTSSGNCCPLVVPSQNSYRMVVLGASRVGKTALVSRFLKGHYEDQYTPTLEDFHRKVYNIRGDMYQLDILDTSGNQPFPAMRRLAILTGDIFLLVFSLDDRDSLEEALRLRQQILDVKSCLRDRTLSSTNGANRGIAEMVVPMALCGNKSDRGPDARVVPSAREVEKMLLSRSKEESGVIIGDMGDVEDCCLYFEVSARRDSNVDALFRSLFGIAGLPHEMSPSLHRKLSASPQDFQLQLVASQKQRRSQRRSFRRMRGRRLKEDPPPQQEHAFGMISPFARRPSVNSDLKYVRSKILGGHAAGQGRDRDRCSIQ
ncbi:GTP-binding protein Rhes-like [Erpetoichthys calabaricus]|uniref:GTP-binding protein Rhes-like n=1 Tax=Erpetoichthys calabaricus TaxID=27687 RepID=A0A8C4TD96_ERPCA|nr:GTP-binding protein Rhes-like [Erpetoichthys calabaricus]